MKARLDAQISIRLGGDDVAQLERVEGALHGAIARANVARVAMRMGLTLLERDPTLVVSAVAEPDRREGAALATFSTTQRALLATLFDRPNRGSSR